MLAQLEDDQIDEVLALSDLKPIMPNTVWNRRR